MIRKKLYIRTTKYADRFTVFANGLDGFRDVRPGDAAAVILALVDGLSLQLTFDPDSFTLDDATRFCEDALRRYLEASS